MPSTDVGRHDELYDDDEDDTLVDVQLSESVSTYVSGTTADEIFTSTSMTVSLGKHAITLKEVTNTLCVSVPSLRQFVSLVWSQRFQ